MEKDHQWDIKIIGFWSICSVRTKEWGLVKLENRRLQKHLTSALQYLGGSCPEEGSRNFTGVHNRRMRVSKHNLKKDKFRLDIRKKLRTMRTTK